MMTALASKQAAVTASTTLSLSSVTASNTMTAAGLITTSGGVLVSGGQGRNWTGASIRATGAGDLVYNTSAVYWGGNGVDLVSVELSWLGWSHFQRASSTAAYVQTMGVNNSTGYWTFYRGHGDASDQSLKSHAQDASTEDCLSMLRQVSAKTYTRIDLPDSGPRLGCIRQDVLAACPITWSNLVGTTMYAREQGGYRD